MRFFFSIFSIYLAVALSFPATDSKTSSDTDVAKSKEETIAKKPQFETAHKVPASLVYLGLKEEKRNVWKEALEEKNGKKVYKRQTYAKKWYPHKIQKREALAQNSAPAPAGAIKLDVKKLLAQ